MYAGPYDFDDDEDDEMLLSLKFPKKELLTKIRENRKQHQIDYEDAFGGYRKQLATRWGEISEYCNRVSKLMNEAIWYEIDVMVDPANLKYSDLDKPDSHIEAYDQAIEMLELTTQDEIELSQTHFKQLVQDKWEWKASFMASSMKYGGP